MHEAHVHGIGRAGDTQPECSPGGSETGGAWVLNESEHALLVEIASMTRRLREEVEYVRAEIADLSESCAPAPAPPSSLRRPA